jgi:hypothetical protein
VTYGGDDVRTKAIIGANFTAYAYMDVMRLKEGLPELLAGKRKNL